MPLKIGPFTLPIKNNPKPPKVVSSKPAPISSVPVTQEAKDYWAQQYAQGQKYGVVTSGGLKSGGVSGVTPYINPYPTSGPAAPSKVPQGGTIRSQAPMLEDWGKPAANLPVPTATKTATPTAAVAPTPAAPAGPDWNGLLNRMLQPTGPNYQSLIAGLQNPGKIADLSTPDLYYIYQKYSQPTGAAFDALGKQIEGLRTGAVGRDDAAKAALEQTFAQTRGDITSASEKAVNEFQARAKALGIGDSLIGDASMRRQDQAARLAGLADIVKSGYRTTNENLANARGVNYDTMAGMAAGGKANAIANLASMVATAQGKAELATQDYYSKAKLAEAQGRHDLAAQYAQYGQQAANNQMQMVKLWAQLKMSSDKAAAASAANLNPSLAANQTSTQENSGLSDMINGLQPGAVKDYLTNAYYESGDPNAAFQKLYATSQAPKPVTSLPKNPGGLFGNMLGNTVGSALNKYNAQVGPAPNMNALQQALQLLQPYTSKFGGITTKTETTSKGKQGVK